MNSAEHYHQALVQVRARVDAVLPSQLCVTGRVLHEDLTKLINEALHPAPRVVDFAGWRVDILGNTATRDGRTVFVSRGMCRLIRLFTSHPPRTTFSTEKLFKVYACRRYAQYSTMVRTAIKRLRQRLDLPVGYCIVNVHGTGYYYDPEAR